MPNNTSIEWCDASANPLRYRNAEGRDVWACVKCSTGCSVCYAEAITKRFGRGLPFTIQNMRTIAPYISDAEIGKLLRSRNLARKRVFLCDMTDLFGEWVPFDLIDRIFAMMALRPDVTFQILTKRPERMAEYLGPRAHDIGLRWAIATDAFTIKGSDYREMVGPGTAVEWTRHGLPNVWLGTSIENQATADQRIPHLLMCPAAIRFLSAEPLLGPVDISRPVGAFYDGDEWVRHPVVVGGIDWVIVGGESGPGARPCNLDWIRSIRDQCKAAGVACFIKQLGAQIVDDESTVAYTVPEERCWPGQVHQDGQRIILKDKKGGSMEEWPADLRVREMPRVEVPHG